MEKGLKIHEDRFLFFVDLIKEFTKRTGIKNTYYYHKVQSEIQKEPLLGKLSYNCSGLSSFEGLLKECPSLQKKGNACGIAPYLCALARATSMMYSEASYLLGEKKAKKALSDAIVAAKSRHREAPDLEGYLPADVIGSSKAAAYPEMVMGRIIDYMISQAAKKGVQKGLGKEETEKMVRKVYIEMLGPLGERQVDRIRGDLTRDSITRQIEHLERQGVIRRDRAGEFKQRIMKIVGKGGC